MDLTNNSQTIPSKVLILIALLQGLALLHLHQSIELEFWPYEEPQWLFSFYSVAVATPIMLILGLSGQPSLVYKWTAIFSLVVFVLGYYIGGQAIPLKHISYEFLLFIFVMTLSIATFKSLMYVQHFATGGPLTYSRLFLLSWRNFLILGLALLFTLSTWGVLMLWAGLFKAIKIDFFYELFMERWFFYPILALANGFGVIIFRQQSNVIDTITRIQQALMKFLLVILVFVSMIFLIALPFTGLQPLWETGGSTLILWMQALMLFFTNAVYQDDPETQPYKLFIHRFIYMGIALLPIYSLISFYGLSLRVEQYGWSVSRCWAFLLWSVFAAFSIGYLWGIIRLRDRWLQQLSWVNVRMGLAVLAFMLAVNSPLLDFRKISVNSQMHRLEAGAVSLADFDYYYFKKDLAKPGYEALQELKAKYKESNPEIVVKIDSFYTNNRDVKGINKSDFLQAVHGITADLPDGLTDTIYKNMSRNVWRMRQNLSYQLISADLNSDSVAEYILVEERPKVVGLTMYYLNEQGVWSSKGLSGIDVNHSQREERKAGILKALENQDFESVNPVWKHLKMGDYTFKVH